MDAEVEQAAINESYESQTAELTTKEKHSLFKMLPDLVFSKIDDKKSLITFVKEYHRKFIRKIWNKQGIEYSPDPQNPFQYTMDIAIPDFIALAEEPPKKRFSGSMTKRNHAAMFNIKEEQVTPIDDHTCILQLYNQTSMINIKGLLRIENINFSDGATPLSLIIYCSKKNFFSLAPAKIVPKKELSEIIKKNYRREINYLKGLSLEFQNGCCVVPYGSQSKADTAKKALKRCHIDSTISGKELKIFSFQEKFKETLSNYEKYLLPHSEIRENQILDPDGDINASLEAFVKTLDSGRHDLWSSSSPKTFSADDVNAMEVTTENSFN